MTTVALVILFAAVTYHTKNPIFFKFQPVVMGIVFGLILLGYQVFDRPLFLMLTDKYHTIFPVEQQMLFDNMEFRELLGRASLYTGLVYLAYRDCRLCCRTRCLVVVVDCSRYWGFVVYLYLLAR